MHARTQPVISTRSASQLFNDEEDASGDSAPIGKTRTELLWEVARGREESSVQAQNEAESLQEATNAGKDRAASLKLERNSRTLESEEDIQTRTLESKLGEQVSARSGAKAPLPLRAVEPPRVPPRPKVSSSKHVSSTGGPAVPSGASKLSPSQATPRIMENLTSYLHSEEERRIGSQKRSVFDDDI